jgi:hypothetical protein
MASASASLPPGLAEALGHMQRAIACPEDVRAKIAALKVPAEEVSGTRGFTTNWRSGTGPARGGGGGGAWQPQRWAPRRDGPVAPQPQYRGPPPAIRRNPADRPRFGNKARADATVEDRMMDRIRDKMNKFSLMTYDATTGWLKQLMDSGETDFLSGFMELVFEKAASEATFTTLYARLLTELRAAFPHINTELRRIFEAFMLVFAEAADEPDVADAAYAAYLTLRERRKFRRGYAAFLAEVATQGALTGADILSTCDVVLTGLEAARLATDQQQLCEEYADCLGSLLKGCAALVRADIGPTLVRVKAAKERVGAPSLTPKARFALMDLEELFE